MLHSRCSRKCTVTVQSPDIGVSGEDEEEMADEEVAAEAKGEDEDAGEVEEPGEKLQHVMLSLYIRTYSVLSCCLELCPEGSCG